MQHTMGGSQAIRPIALAVFKYPHRVLTINWDFLT
jgi:hypothetical protein